MTLINDSVKKKIIESMENILSIDDTNWNNLDLNIKLKIMHHYCNYFSKKNKDINWNQIQIPLKSIKPKKLIQFVGINNNLNKQLFSQYNNQILEYTVEFRKKFIQKNKLNYNFSSLSQNTYSTILQEYTKIIYDFLNKNINLIKPITVYNNLLLNNNDKLIISNLPNKLDIQMLNSSIILKFNNNIELILQLEFYNDKITNNLPVKFNIKLINNF